MLYVISDLHFNHKRILELERTEFDTIEDHNTFIIDSINGIVKFSDELYILGDVGDPRLLKYLNGNKLLLMGNHDKNSKKLYLNFVQELRQYPFYYSNRIIFSHIPVPVDKHILNVHGHLHGAILDSPNHFNVSCKHLDYKPISIVDLQKVMQKLSVPNYKFLEEWYADKYLFTEDRSDVVMSENGLIDLESTRELRVKDE